MPEESENAESILVSGVSCGSQTFEMEFLKKGAFRSICTNINI